MQDYFSDLIGNVTVTGPVVRIDFVKLSPASNKDQQKMEFSHRVVMPIEGFLRSLQLQEEVRNKLIADGVVTRKADAPTAQ
ncbi:hypothetical protein [Janthinobacterium sp. 17J80-10]|uniref:hypothetical protein n=1 Tax=Janthinobacterium sp. 17J80-10 TaxID=2497863 RepID=UPI001005A3FB|nr:hypothetical protein [Janthinobacterium sp. 17J80-10]QAU35558.1 hypothetical protein EKL02_16075 [Janthinobacterium sp. 17J80-10]